MTSYETDMARLQAEATPASEQPQVLVAGPEGVKGHGVTREEMEGIAEPCLSCAKLREEPQKEAMKEPPSYCPECGCVDFSPSNIGLWVCAACSYTWPPTLILIPCPQCAEVRKQRDSHRTALEKIADASGLETEDPISYLRDIARAELEEE